MGEGDGKPFKDIKLDISRAKYWLGVGAQPSEPAWRLLSMVRVCVVVVFCYVYIGWGLGGRREEQGGREGGRERRRKRWKGRKGKEREGKGRKGQTKKEVVISVR